jgi:hypothetical protein
MATKKKAKKKASGKKKPAAPARSAERSARRVAKRVARKPAPRAKARVQVRAKVKAKVKVKAGAKAKARVKVEARPSAPRAKPIRRRDGSGHLDPKYAAELRAQSSHPDAEPGGFIERPRSKDDLVEELGEGFVEEATSAEHSGENALDAEVSEERGGPFVETSGATEFAHGTDPSNPKGASREPFPRT